MKTKEELLKEFEERYKKIHPLPWTFNGNYPFNVDMKKPRPSLSKHDDKSQAFWHWDDGNYAAWCINAMPQIIELLRNADEKK